MEKNNFYVIYLMANDLYNYAAADDDITYDRNYTLYAYTDNKKFYKEFKKVRNPKLFKYFTYDKNDPRELSLFIRLNDTYPDYYLDSFEYDTYDVGDDDIIYVRQMSIVSTDREHEMVLCNSKSMLHDSVSGIIDVGYDKCDLLYSVSNLYKQITDFYNVFNDNIREALKILEFLNIMNNMMTPEYNEIPFDMYTADEFSMYWKLFSNTYNEDWI